ncbi:hypothetical protein OEA41_004091 [Lepraria neglecta]|uniref:Uncharacterized protein n=1 Tax=Lepraria neglecta TaxID=209136 RepID=A0AAD9Z892_9LECA|nr:hypothetical protein OEA41_004091 [Lepraria neglecta]
MKDLPLALPSNNASIAITLAAGSPFLNHEHNLTAKLDGKTFIRSPHTFTLTRAVAVALQLLLVKSGLTTKPWCYSGNVRWILRETEGKLPDLDLGTTPLEIYILLPDVRSYLIDAGIPRRLLKEVIPAWRNLPSNVQPSSTYVPWHIFVIDYLFNNPHLCYTALRREGPAYQNQLLARIMVVGPHYYLGQNKNPKQYELLRLGIFSSDHLVARYKQPTRCVMKFLKPYSLLAPTKLIGREAGKLDLITNTHNQCNNSFYLSPRFEPAMLCSDESPSRSAFENHVFLMLDFGERERVSHTCAGPQKGEHTLARHIDVAIEKTEHNILYKALGPAGTFKDVETGPGVISLQTPASFLKPVAKAPPKTPNKDMNLLQRMTEHFGPRLGDLSDVVVNITRRAVVATYTFRPKISTDNLISINIFRIKMPKEADESVKEAMKVAKHQGATDEAYNFRRASMKKGSFTELEPATKRVSADETIAPHEKERTVYTYRELYDDGSSGIAGGVRVFQYVPEPYGGAYFLMTINEDAVESYRDNASLIFLLLTAEVTVDNRVKLFLLANRNRDEVVTITLYGPNLEQDSFGSEEKAVDAEAEDAETEDV